MSELVFIRHAETDSAGTFCGHSNPPINSRGRDQISELLTTLGSKPFDAIYSSDLLRAVDTARSLGKAFNLPIKTESNLREIFFGDWEGLTWAEIEQQDATYACRWVKAFPTVPAPNGEAYTAFATRILKECNLLLTFGKGKRIAIITHGGVMRVVLRNLLHYDELQAWELTKSYCSSFVYYGVTNVQEVCQ